MRPSTLAKVVGNRGAVAALQRAVSASDRSHVYLLTGPSGCGKTTLARAFANALADNVEVIERNAASDRGIDMARRLESEATAPPLYGSIRAVIIDECHALTKDAMGSLLKVLEDVPSYQYYLLCTTNPEKLLPTVKNRCDPISVARLNDDELLEVLVNAVAEGEISDPGDAVLEAILEAAEGCPRKALVLLEKQDGMPESQAIEVVGQAEANEKTTRDLCQALIKQSWNDVRRIWADVEKEEPESVRRAVLGYLAACMKKSTKAEEASRFAEMIDNLAEPTYDGGRPLLLAMLFRATRI